MGRRLTIILVLLAGGVLVVSWTLGRWRQQSSAQDLATYVQQLNSVSALVRLRSAIGVLRLDPTHPDAELIGAEALIALGRFPEARRVLLELEEESLHTHRHTQVLLLRARCYLEEAAGWLTGSTPQSVGVATAKIEAMLTEADRVFDSLKTDPLTDAEVTKLRAQSAYLQTALLGLQLAAHQSSYAAAEAVGLDSKQSRKVQAITDRLKDQVQQQQQKLVDLCEQAIALDPQDAAARRLLFLMWVDNRMFDRARDVAAQVAQMSSVDGALAGKIANVLLELESRYQQQTTPRDVAVSRELLYHEDLRNTDHIDYRTAVTRLALHEGHPAEAQHLAELVLARFPGHTSATCLLAAALIDQGKSQQAVDLLNRLKRRVRSADIYYVLGVALIRMGQANQGRDMLRQCIEMQPTHLPAVVRLAESLAEEGFIIEAEPEVITAVALSPDHPWVLRLHLRLLAAQMDYAGFSELLSEQLPGGDSEAWRPEHAAVVCAMVLGDQSLVDDLTGQMGADPLDQLVSIMVHCWRQSNPENRIDVSAVAVRVITEKLDTDPLALPDPPAVPVLGRWADNGEPLPSLVLLTRSYFLEHPYDQALWLLELALDRWAGQPVLLDLAVRFCVWTHQRLAATEYLRRLIDTGETMSPTAQIMLRAYLNSDGAESLLAFEPKNHGAPDATDTPTSRLLALGASLRDGDRPSSQAILADLLTGVSWSQQPLLVAIQDALDRGGTDRAGEWLSFAERINPQIALLAQARLSILLGQPTDALHDIKGLLRDESRPSEIKQAGTELLAHASLALGQEDIAIGMFEDLALSSHDETDAMRLASVDILLTKRRIKEAVASLTVMLRKPGLSPRWQDRVLVRAGSSMRPNQFRAIIDKLLQSHQDDPLLMLYKAQSLANEGDLFEAERLFDEVLKLRPDAPRALMAVAKLAVVRGDHAQARRLYQQLMDQGGRASEAAKRELDRLDQASDQETGFTIESVQ